jgi:hypothetical protein
MEPEGPKRLSLLELVALLDAPGRWISAEDADFEAGEYRLRETDTDGRDRAISWVYINPEGEAAAVLKQSYDNACTDPRITDPALPLAYGPYCSSWCLASGAEDLEARIAAGENRPPRSRAWARNGVFWFPSWVRMDGRLQRHSYPVELFPVPYYRRTRMGFRFWLDWDAPRLRGYRLPEKRWRVPFEVWEIPRE